MLGMQLNLCLEIKNFAAKLEKYAEKRGIFNYTIVGKTEEQILQDWIEMSGVGPTKLAQILSNNAKEMEKLEQKYPSLVKAIKNTKSNCSFQEP